MEKLTFDKEVDIELKVRRTIPCSLTLSSIDKTLDEKGWVAIQDMIAKAIEEPGQPPLFKYFVKIHEGPVPGTIDLIANDIEAIDFFVLDLKNIN